MSLLSTDMHMFTVNISNVYISMPGNINAERIKQFLRAMINKVHILHSDIRL